MRWSCDRAADYGLQNEYGGKEVYSVTVLVEYSLRSGRFEIIVQPFPVPTRKWPVSTGGGIQPRWRADGKELYFVAPDGKLMAASITAAGATFAAGTPAPLFPVAFAPGLGANNQQYAVSRDGRFLIDQPVEMSSTAPITLILNWRPKP